jgi:hypothetical protein
MGSRVILHEKKMGKLHNVTINSRTENKKHLKFKKNIFFIPSLNLIPTRFHTNLHRSFNESNARETLFPLSPSVLSSKSKSQTELYSPNITATTAHITSSVFNRRSLATDFRIVIITLSLNYTLQISLHPQHT